MAWLKLTEKALYVMNSDNTVFEEISPMRVNGTERTYRTSDLTSGAGTIVVDWDPSDVEPKLARMPAPTPVKPPGTGSYPKPSVKWIFGCPNVSSRNGAAITGIVLHHTDGDTADGAINWFLNPASRVSAHYIIERDGTIFQMVKDSDKAWHCYGNNANTIGIENVHRNVLGHITPVQEQALIKLCKYLMAEYKVSPANVRAHNQMPGNEGATECNGTLFGADSSATTGWVKRNLA